MMQEHDHIGHPAPFTIERYLCGELSGDERAELEAHTDQCESCGNRVAHSHEEKQAFQADFPYAAFKSAHLRRSSVQRPGSLFDFTRLLRPALGVALALVLLVMGGELLREGESDGIRFKGATVSLTMSRVEAGGLVAVHGGDTLTPGTRLVVHYNAGDNTHMALMGIDSSTEPVVYFPMAGAKLQELGELPRGTLPLTLELDATHGRQRFIAIFAQRAVALGPVLEGLSRGLSIEEAASGLTYTALWFEKP